MKDLNIKTIEFDIYINKIDLYLLINIKSYNK